jgi:hypothetical protein
MTRLGSSGGWTGGMVSGVIVALALLILAQPASAGEVACCVCTECPGANVCAVIDLSTCKNFCNVINNCDGDSNAPAPCSTVDACPAVAPPAAPLLGAGGLAALALLLGGLGAAAIGWRRTRPD